MAEEMDHLKDMSERPAHRNTIARRKKALREGKKVKAHRPNKTYTPELGIKICKAMVEERRGLTFLCQKYDWFPRPETITRWVEKHDEFREAYYFARQAQAGHFADMQIEAAEMVEDYVMNSDDNPGKLSAVVQAARLKAESARWAASRLAPKDWGDKMNVEGVLKHDTEGNVDNLLSELATLAGRTSATGVHSGTKRISETSSSD